jgi:hypothetical protein
MVLVSLCGFFLLKHKSEVFKKFHDFQAHVESLFDHKILAHKKRVKKWPPQCAETLSGRAPPRFGV